MSAQGRAVSSPRRVIVRAYGDEPVELVAHGGGTYVEVMNELTGDSIRFPASHVYEYAERLFSALKNAYATKDRIALASLWNGAKRYASK